MQTATRNIAEYLPLPSRTMYDLKKLNSLHRSILRMCVMNPAVTNIEIAEALGCTPQTVCITKASTLFQEQFKILQASMDAQALETAQTIEELQALSVLRIGQVLADDALPASHAGKKLMVSVAQDMLNRGGHGAVQKSIVAHATLEDIKEIREMASKRGFRPEPTAYSSSESESESESEIEIEEIEEVEEIEVEAGLVNTNGHQAIHTNGHKTITTYAH